MHNMVTILSKVIVLILPFQIFGCFSNSEIEKTNKNHVSAAMNTKIKGVTSMQSETLNEERFWNLIESSMKKSGNDTDKAALLLTKKLQNLSSDEIIAFEFKLSEKLIEADHFNVMIPFKIMFGSVTDDPYLYFRCWLIFQGEMIFENTLRNPDSLTEHVTTDTFLFAEPLLYVATNAYSEVTGISLENDSFPRIKAYEAGLNYDDGFIETKGEDWEESDLPKRVPKLWKMFNAK